MITPGRIRSRFRNVRWDIPSGGESVLGRPRLVHEALQ